ncbi:mannitol dehydrogenase family protein, partial [uncultured Duncaniella sp.]|uniref:mannitol dehydrogenase family protein n=2 Tax=uncultured Duncaniella sp. TaxID=2768039 RepID=UPI00345BCD9A
PLYIDINTIMKNQILPYSYDRSNLSTGILHIGVGNFHRAHEEFYTNLLLADPSQSGWAICGAMLMPQDKALYEALKSRNGEYTLTVCGRDGNDEAHTIGSLTELLWAGENPEAIIEKIADPATKIITLTITEGGYNTDRATGDFMLDTPAVAADLKRPAVPTTAFGFIAEGLRRRMERSGAPVTILSCDNLQHNGNTARRAFMTFFEAQDTALAEWAKANVTFPNSMVDRITPATRPEDIKRLNEINGTDDKAPVYCEDFIQWVIEDKFAAGRPAWEKVGVEFTDDVTAYENMKLSLLNASHTLLSYPSFLAGYRKVDAAMHDERIVRLVREFMDTDITPFVPAPGDTDLALYKQTLIERFANRSVSDQVARLCFDGISKFPVYIMPNLIKMLSDGKADLSRVAYLFAAYRHYLKFHTDDNGENFEIAEPWMTEADKALISSDNPVDFLGLSAFTATDLSKEEKFVGLYLEMCKAIAERGAMPVLESIL